MLDEPLRRLLEREISELDALLAKSEELRQVTEGSNPGFERLAALSQVLNSFYTGLERILVRIVEHADGAVPGGERWHAELLTQASKATDSRAAVISEECYSALREYMAFRHRSRHAYAHHLEWLPMADLVAGLPAAWQAARGQIVAFMA